jgi:hypothetical protein
MALMGGYQALRPSITFSQLWKDTHQRNLVPMTNRSKSGASAKRGAGASESMVVIGRCTHEVNLSDGFFYFDPERNLCSEGVTGGS